MQMILIERFFFECKYYSHEDKSASQPKRLAHGL